MDILERFSRDHTNAAGTDEVQIPRSMQQHRRYDGAECQVVNILVSPAGGWHNEEEVRLNIVHASKDTNALPPYKLISLSQSSIVDLLH